MQISRSIRSKFPARNIAVYFYKIVKLFIITQTNAQKRFPNAKNVDKYAREYTAALEFSELSSLDNKNKL